MTRWILGPLVVALCVSVAGCASGRPKTAGLTPIKRTMTVTAYCDCKQCCNWKRNWYGRAVVASGPSKGQKKKVGQTASGAQARKGSIAADKRFAFGTVIDVPGYGRGVVHDRGSAIQGDKLDVFFKKHKDALRWGRQTLPVTIWVHPGQGVPAGD